ncbi:DUF1489 domain-containing protein [Xinfangfangia sp. D13-10-4-6]|uniref:DUF1489 family protein n=1 Tax=Pseudogemmobacter hezensis TaxID=2737662 RepID=UPI001553C332|nr:DUF1489 domain-containing protein [Pseudogemmobacter hezensis]NPD15688.1 DUF1489 domain-containing protein [Pseudogemmobacter hezensis]
MGFVNLLKLSVGSESVADLVAWQEQNAVHWPQGRAGHVTRMWPKREAELLAGGSLYWVIKGVILCRQRVLALEQVDHGDGIARCAIILDREIIRTAPAPRRPFQGWRYIAPEDVPPDLIAGRDGDDSLPPELERALSEIGLR